MRFPYIKFPIPHLTRKWVSRPYIPVKISTTTGTWEGYGLIDSGADQSLMNISIAQDLGLDLNEAAEEKFSGIEAGILKAKLHQVSLQIIGINENIKLTVGFVDSAAVGVILGQEGFFDAFKIKFEKDKSFFEVSTSKS